MLHLSINPKEIAAFFLTKTSLDLSFIREACNLILATRLSDKYFSPSAQFASMQPAKKIEFPDKLVDECSKYCAAASRYWFTRSPPLKLTKHEQNSHEK